MSRSRKPPRTTTERCTSNKDPPPSSVQLTPEQEEVRKKIAHILELNAKPMQMTMSHFAKAKSPSSERGRLVTAIISKTGVYKTAKQKRRGQQKERTRSLIGTSLISSTTKFSRPRTRRGGAYRIKKKGHDESANIINKAKEKAMSPESIKALSPLFFNGNRQTSAIVGIPRSSHIRPATDLFVLDTKLGFRYPANEEEDHILLLPREKVLEGHPDVSRILSSLECAQQNSTTSLTRGGKRIVAFQSGGSKYINPGLYPKRAGKGVAHRTVHKMPPTQWQTLLKYIKYCERKACNHLNGKFLTGYGHAKSVVSIPGFPAPPGQKPSDMFSTFAAAKDVCLNSHTDEDTIYSLVTTIDCNQSVTFRIDDPICCYFTFPELGMAVALRPGDILLFNPRTYHSISSRCHEEQHIWCISLYLKTRLVGGNDNSLPLDHLQKEIKQMMV